MLHITTAWVLYSQAKQLVLSQLHITMLPHPTYQRPSLERLFRGHKV